MKKFRRITTMLLALSLALSIAVIPAAATNNRALDADPWVATLLAADDCEIRYTEDGLARIITATLDEDELLPLTRSSNPYYSHGTTYWNDNSTDYYQCENGRGTVCRVITTNVDSENNLKVTYDYKITDTPISTSETIKPTKTSAAVIQSTNGQDLTCRVDVIMKPDVNPSGTGNGLSAEWEFMARQD